MRLLSVDSSSAFNIILPNTLVFKLLNLGVSHPICLWIKDFLTEVMWVGPRCLKKESAYRVEVDQLATWCTMNNLVMNTIKTKELIYDFRGKKLNI